jgi:ribonuclease HII
MLILGIDDAGRGPVIGPMILAGVLITKETEKEFAKLGIKDSKQVLPAKRAILEKEIKEKVLDFHIVQISVDEIDDVDKEGLNLNQREAIAASMIINKLNKGKEQIKVIIDCPSVNISSWKEYLEKFVLGKSNLSIVCEHKADENYLSVSAASILAKEEREREVKNLKDKFKVDFGSGYSSDDKTRKFIYENYEKFSGLGLFRESWGTIKKHKAYKKQKKLF